MGPDALDLAGLPEPVARGLEAVAEMARKMLREASGTSGLERELPVWRLGVIGPLTRDEIYDEYGCRC